MAPGGGVRRAHLPEDDLKPEVLIRTGVGALVREGTPMLKVVQDDEASPTGRRPVGRCSMRSSVTAPGRCWRRRCRPRSPRTSRRTPTSSTSDGHRLVVRNGYHAPREVTTAAGAVPVRAPRVNDKRIDEVTGERARFASAILPAWARKSPRVAEVLPLLYLHGLSTGDFAPALEQFLGTGAGLSRGDDHPADRAVAGRGGRVQPALAGRHGLRVRVGRRDPPQGPPRAGQGVPAGDHRRARRRHQGAGRAR